MPPNDQQLALDREGARRVVAATRAVERYLRPPKPARGQRGPNPPNTIKKGVLLADLLPGGFADVAIYCADAYGVEQPNGQTLRAYEYGTAFSPPLHTGDPVYLGWIASPQWPRWYVLPPALPGFKIGVLLTDLVYGATARFRVYSGPQLAETDSGEELDVSAWEWQDVGDVVVAGTPGASSWNGWGWYLHVAKCATPSSSS